MGWPTGQGPNRPRSGASGTNPPAEGNRYEQEFGEQDGEEEPSVVYVRQEAPSLLWRSIVQGFGLALGFFLGTAAIWILVSLLLALLFHQAAPGIPSL
jgi:hypothetical protein